MPKIRNQLYSNPERAQTHEKDNEIVMLQAARVGDRKFTAKAVFHPYNFYINMAGEAEQNANHLLEKILKEIRTSNKDLPIIDDVDHNDFMRASLNAIVWAYGAIEAYANDVIDACASEKKKHRLSRKDLSEKLKTILPNFGERKKLPHKLWNRFHKLDTVRHKIMHTKRNPYWVEGDKWEETLLHQLTNGGFQGMTALAIQIIDHFDVKPKETNPVTLTVQRGMQSRPVKKT